MKFKRLLAGFIAVAMTIGMIPALTFADEAENGTKETAAIEKSETKEEEKKPAVKETKPAEEKKEPEKKAEPEVKPAESKAEEPAEKEDKKAEEPAEKEDKKEAETETPAETEEKQPEESKETEPSDKQPAESEDKAEPEAPAETAPEETEKPDTVTGKIPGDSDSSTPKKAPITIGKIEGIRLDESYNLKWNTYQGPVSYFYDVMLENFSYFSFGGDKNTFTLNNLDTYVNDAIANGELKKSADNTYTVYIYAYDDDGMLVAKGSKKLDFGSRITATEPTVEKIPGVKIKKGKLYFDKVYKNSEAEYSLYINNVLAWFSPEEVGEVKELNLNAIINRLIREHRLAKPSNNKYNIFFAVRAFDGVFQRYTTTYTYKTSAKPVQTYTFENVRQENGRLKFDAIKGAKKYVCFILEIGDFSPKGYAVSTSNSIDLNSVISRFIDAGMEKGSYYLYFLHAEDGNGAWISQYSGKFDFNVEPNPLAVKGKTAKVKNSKLKKKKQTLSASQVINGVGTGRGKMTYTKLSGNKNITINKTTGKVTIKKKGLKKGKTYSVKVKIFAAGNHGYDPSEEIEVTFKIKVTK